MIWTISYNGVEKTLADWGLREITRTLVSQGLDTLAFTADGAAADADALFPFQATVTLYRDRTQNSDGSFSGGTPWFRGIVIQIPRAGSPQAESMQYKIAGPWWFLENLVFQQPFNAFAGYTIPNDPNSPPVFVASESDTHLFLNLAPINTPTLTGKITTGAQIIEALNWALKPFVTAGAPPPFQVGAVTPALDVPIDEVRDITCAEVIHKMLRWSPDAVAWFDYTTSPPTFNCQLRSELATADVDLSAGNLAHSLQINARYDLRAPYVKIRYETTNSIQGRQSLVVVTDQYPATPPADPLQAFAGLDFTVDLQGANVSKTTARIAVDPVNALAADATAQMNWWLGRHPQFKPYDPTQPGSPADPFNPVDTFTLVTGSATRIPTTPGEADHGYTNELTSGQLTSWMNFGAQRMTFKCAANVKYRNETRPKLTELSFQCLCTNGTSGTYDSTQTNAFAEPQPAGLAQFMYEALNPLQFEGRITLQEPEISSAVLVGNKLNLIHGALAEWSTMVSLIQQVEENLDTGRTTLHFGPPKHLSAGDLVDLLRVNRNRHLWVVFSMQQQGTPGNGGGQFELGQNTPEKNSSSRGSPPATQVTSSTVDGSAGVIAHQSKDDGGDALTYWGQDFKTDTPMTQPANTFAGSSLYIRYSDANGNPMIIRPVKICMNGVPGTMYFFCSDFIPDS